jgi:DNA helicase-2/ATP-dependent DNA helicase PcrA
MSNFEHALKNLNPGQRQAVDTLQGPVLVVAGPGTGKTQVLAVRIASILQNTDAKASNILCLTFTEAAVQAMRQRLIKIVGNEAYYVRIHTFHGFCNEVIQNFPDKFAFARELNQLSDLDRIKLMREIIDGLDPEKRMHLRPFYDKYRFQAPIISAIQTLKREGILPEQLKQIVEENLAELNDNPKINNKTGKPTLDWSKEVTQAERQLELADIYSQYQALIVERGFYDYEDMILFVVEKFKQDEELLAHYQERYLYILVDEYQDTNGAQNEIVRLLGSFDPSPNIFAVGDDDQAIYRFQGANVENLLSFTNQFQNVETIPIVDNYRSSQLILDAAGSLIAHNEARLVNYLPDLSKHLNAKQDIPDHNIEVLKFTNQDVENRYVVSKVQELIDSGIAAAEIAILYRRHSDADDLTLSLVQAGIPLRLAVGQNALDEVIVNQYLNLLRAIEYTDPNRDRLLTQILFYEFLAIPKLEAFKAIRYAGEKKIPLVELLTDPNELLAADLGITEESKLVEFIHNLLQWKQDSNNLRLIELVQRVGKESRLIPHLLEGTKEDGGVDVEKLNAVNSFYAYVRNLNTQRKHMTLGELLSDIDLLTENQLAVNEQELDINLQGVQLMTAHAAKGLEFKHVFIVKCHDDNWGASKRSSGIKLPEEIFKPRNDQEDPSSPVESKADLELEDERRLFFVALTRAKEQIYLTYAQEYKSGISTKEVSPSRFIAEIDPALVEFPDTAKFEEFNLEATTRELMPLPVTDYNDKEREYLKCLVEKFRLSPTSLNMYINCPLQFKFECLLLVPRVHTKSEVLGTAIHFALEHFFRQLKAGTRKDKEYVLYLFRSAVERELLNEADMQQTLAEGTEILSTYYDQYLEEFAAPAEVEYSFSGHHMVMTGEGFDPIPLVGKIDKVEWIDRDNSIVKIVDYKTKSPISENAIKGLTKSDDGGIFRQLAFYKLLSLIDDKFKPALNKPKYNVQSVEVDFLKPSDSGKYRKINLEISDQDVDDLKAKIVDVMTRVRNLEFGGSAEYPLCDDCEYCQMLKSK